MVPFNKPVDHLTQVGKIEASSLCGYRHLREFHLLLQNIIQSPMSYTGTVFGFYNIIRKGFYRKYQA